MPKPVSLENAEVVANPDYDRRLRRRFPPEERRRILNGAAACTNRGELAALLRRERLYSSQLATWRSLVEGEGEGGLKLKRAGRKPLKDAKERRIEQLEAEKAKLERKLLIAEKLIELQKKAQELLAAVQPAERP